MHLATWSKIEMRGELGPACGGQVEPDVDQPPARPALTLLVSLYDRAIAGVTSGIGERLRERERPGRLTVKTLDLAVGTVGKEGRCYEGWDGVQERRELATSILPTPISPFNHQHVHWKELGDWERDKGETLFPLNSPCSSSLRVVELVHWSQ